MYCLQFLMYCSDDQLLKQGSGGLLDRQLRGLVRLALPSLRPSPSKVAAAAAATSGAAVGSAASSASSGASSSLDSLEAAAALVPAYMLPSGIQRPALLGSSDSGGISASRDEDSSSAGGSSEGAGSDSSSERWERAEQWERMALQTAVCCAGLVQYLLDCRPDESLD